MTYLIFEANHHALVVEPERAGLIPQQLHRKALSQQGGRQDSPEGPGDRPSYPAGDAPYHDVIIGIITLLGAVRQASLGHH